ncbi:MAG: ArgE/DapE family deacylase [Candidatus Heimdallarchaeota archaeon]|nr:MAG: ArgE/DapE family deacylase [Candidatus Heimdallarchaeota archaeon]
MGSHKSAASLWVRKNKDELISLLQDLVRIPSITGKEYDVQKFILEKLKEIDLDTKFIFPDINVLKNHDEFFETTSFVNQGYDNRPNVFSVLKGKGNGSSLCLSGHVDVVSPEPLTEWTRDPWGGEIEGNLLFGRGSGDMKAGIAAMVFAVQALKETDTKLSGDIFLETTIEEEDGGVGGNLYMRITQPKPNAAIIPEPSDYTIGLASAGVMYFRVVVPGFPAHAATAHFGENAILKMVPIIEALKNLNKERQKTISYPYAEWDPSMKGRATTINIGVISAGDWPSTVPGLCEIKCRVGWPPGETYKEVRDQIENTIMDVAKKDNWLREHPPRIEWFGWRARPHEQNPDHPFVKLLEDQVIKHIGRRVAFTGGAAGLDTRFFVHHGVPAVVFGPKAERIHSSDERVDLESTIKVTEVLVEIMTNWCGLF